MIANTHYGYVGKSKAHKFTYTGNYKVRDDGVVELLTSGTIVFLEPKIIDVFMVGGGAMGAVASQTISPPTAFAGGGGGYTRTVRKISVAANESVSVTIGAGGQKGARAGGSSGWSTLTVEGGKDAVSGDGLTGGAGGSGGGGSAIRSSDGGSGGSDGNNGENATYRGGSGQGFTTREFGEATGKIYAGGGGGGRYVVSSTPVISMGGTGGGGAGGWQGDDKAIYQAPSAGGANTGGGGGGGFMAGIASPRVESASGGSGIVCFRESVELPELAGTWVLNNRLYAPETDFNETINFTAQSANSYLTCTRVYTGIISGSNYLQFAATDRPNSQFYNFTTNKWTYENKTWVFPVGANGSDEFLRWLASNATKQ